MNGNVEIASIKDLKEGRYVVIDGEPCKVVSMDLSKTGKHGAMKAHINAISLFTGVKKTLLKPVDASCEIPIIIKKSAQIIALLGEKLQLMDLQTYETFELDCPPEFKEKAVAGAELEIQDVLGKKIITRIKG
jgi:translation initiation factor 5A